jgi:hypothetical protein
VELARHARGARTARRLRTLARLAGSLLAAAVAIGCGATGPDDVAPSVDGASPAIGESLPPASGVPAGVELSASHPLSAPQADSATVWAVGDGADGGIEAKEVAEMMATEGLDRLLYLGDVYPDGTAEDYALAYDPVYGRFAEQTAPTPGNHEWEFSEDAYFPYWKDVYGEELGFFYSFEVAGWEILSLNSAVERDAGSNQVAWLEEQLQESGTCRLAFWHVPRYGAGERHPDDESLDVLWDTLRGHAEIVLNGHEHNMERLEPIEGMEVLISGAGGHTLYPVDDEDPQLAFGQDEEYGALRLELEPGLARYAFLDAEGTVLESGETSCRR